MLANHNQIVTHVLEFNRESLSVINLFINGLHVATIFLFNYFLMLYIRRGDSDVMSVQGGITAFYEQHSSLGLDLLTQSFSFLSGQEIMYHSPYI